MSKAALALIQTGLRDLGYAPGPLDGIYGARTRTAVQAWLDADGAPATVAIAPQTRNIIHQGKARYPVAEIVVHCSANLVKDLLDALGKSYACIEIDWQTGARWKPRAFKWRDPRFFTFGPDQEELRLLTRAASCCRSTMSLRCARSSAGQRSSRSRPPTP